MKQNLKKQKKLLDEPVCAVDYAFRRVGGKYKGRVLWCLHNSNNLLRYGQLRKILKDCTAKMLTQTLRELEDDLLITRKVYHEVPPRVEYSLSDMGKELIPFISHLKDWGAQQMKKNNLKMIGPDI